MDFACPVASSTRSTACSDSQHMNSASSKVDLYCELQLKSDIQVALQNVHSAAASWLSSGLTVALGMHDPHLVGSSLLSQTCSTIRIEPAVPENNCSQLQLSVGERIKSFSACLIGSCSSSVEVNPIVFPYCQTNITILPYHLHEGESEPDEMREEENENNLTIFKRWNLPNKEFDHMWENLHFEDSIKTTLLQYTSTALVFSDKNVNSKLITWNRVALLHGPPGSGKTSLCKALAQKLSIRLSRRFSSSLLLSINSPSLFSRWFSESGKMVIKAFEQIRRLLEKQDRLVVILIDEIESISASRAAKGTCNEPSDFVRVVNALLTQIDMLTPFPNALVLTTSNLTESCDAAFIDRADLKLYIPSPNANCRYEILNGSIQELIRVGLLTSCEDFILPPTLESGGWGTTQENEMLMNIIRQTEGFSGRAIRKLPFLAYGCFSTLAGIPAVTDFLLALSRTTHSHIDAQAKVAFGSRLYQTT